MRLKFLVDMNLSPQWVPVLRKHGWQAVHWSTLGDPGASDKDIMDWARDHQYVVFTHAWTSAPCWRSRTKRGRVCYRSARKTLCRTIWKSRSLPLSISMKPTCPLGPWSWLTRAEAGFECCRYETTSRALPFKEDASDAKGAAQTYDGTAGRQGGDCTGGGNQMRIGGVDFPEPLLNALRDGRLVVFAGVSMGPHPTQT